MREWLLLLLLAASTPVLAQKKPVAVRKPSVAAKKPTVAVKKPTVAVKKPTVAVKKPAPAKKPGLPPEALAFPSLPDDSQDAARASAFDGAMVEVVASGRGRIEYGVGVARAIGFGALPPPTLAHSRAQDTLHAREAALGDALRTLGMAVQQVRVTADTRVSNYVLSSDDVRVKVAAAVRGAQVVDEKLFANVGLYRVVVQTPLVGAGSVSEAVGVAAAPTAPQPGTPGGPPPEDAVYTGLLIDCRGLRVAPARTPRVFDTDRQEVYGTLDVTSEFLDEFGMASYPRSARTAQGNGTRVGEHPLVVRAVSVRDARIFPVISAADARRIREANQRDRFLDRAAVSFLVDP